MSRLGRAYTHRVGPGHVLTHHQWAQPHVFSPESLGLWVQNGQGLTSMVGMEGLPHATVQPHSGNKQTFQSGRHTMVVRFDYVTFKVIGLET